MRDPSTLHTLRPSGRPIANASAGTQAPILRRLRAASVGKPYWSFTYPESPKTLHL